MDPLQQSPPSQQPLPNDADQSAAMSDQKPATKAPVVRGARACTVCRAAKMKCVGADDGNNIPCQRCKRSGLECIFEKHRRGRKPGSRLSEASKMLRRLEKGLNNAKQKSQNNEIVLPPLQSTGPADGRYRAGDSYGASSSRFPNNDLPPLNLVPQDGYARSTHQSDSEMDQDDDEIDRTEGGMYPAKLIKQNSRNSSFFKTILNPEQVEPTAHRQTGGSDRGYSQTSSQSPTLHSTPQPVSSLTSIFSTPKDPIEAGLLDEKTVQDLFDMFYIRLNPFINLFDPALHSVNYVRSRCPFLFTTLVMACCKFFKPELYRPALKLAHEFAVLAFAGNWKRVEVVQAFACMTYWKEPEDQCTWTYIGYACRMAVELGLNRYVGKNVTGESEFQKLERRNRERTYLVLFVHDRSLSMQTGKQWMLPEDELVRHSMSWHEEGGQQIRQEDVILAAFVHLRRIASETTDVFNLHESNPASHHGDLNYDIMLRNCNQKLNQWDQTWRHEMQRAHGESFHFAFLRLFQLYVRLFLNSFGLNSSNSQTGRASTNVQALNACYTSAMEHLQIVGKDLASMSMLRYGQDTITVMTAYSAVVLLKLLRGHRELADMKEGVISEIYEVINRTADAYNDTAALSPASHSASYHSRFLKSLIQNDRQKEQEKYKRVMASANHRSKASHSSGSSTHSLGYQQSHLYSQSSMSPAQGDHSNLQYALSGGVPPPTQLPTPSSSASSASSPTYSQTYTHSREVEYGTPSTSESVVRGATNSYSLPGISATYAQYQAQPISHQDALYWRNMFNDLGFGENTETTYAGGYQNISASDSGAVGMGQTGYGSVSYRDAHHSDHGYQSHQYSYPMMNTYPAPAYNGR
ncbi:hypothetical protein AcV5_005800 [Taiwanofungus camphoratus]|nr:hypothetical protein AcV5_005800 [Antrodia cinnamomea]